MRKVNSWNAQRRRGWMASRVDINSFGLSSVDAQANDQWRLKITEEIG